MGKLVLPIVLGVIGLVLVAGAAILGWAVMPNVIDNQIKDEVRLVNGTETWDKWEQNPVDVFLDFYVFHVNNPDEVLKGDKPNLTEFGPFVYNELRQKINIVHDEEKDTLAYTERVTYFFNSELSVHPTDTESIYNVVNTPFLIVVHAVYEISPELAKIVVPLFQVLGETIVRRNVSVRDMVFDGMELHSIFKLVAALKTPPPLEFSGNRFGYYRGKNGTDDETYVVNTGVTEHHRFGSIVEYNGMEKLDYWHVPHWYDADDPETQDSFCNMINGTDGSVFPPFRTKEDELRIFVSDICRSIYLVFDQEVEHRDLNGYRYVFPDAFFLDPKDNPDNYCFCTSPEGGLYDECAEGVIRIFPCKDGAPLVTSSPHFYKAGPEFRAGVDGMKPDKETHATFIELEPKTGLMLNIDKKLQISVEMQPLAGIPGFETTRNYLFPAFWAREHTSLDDKNAEDLIDKLFVPIKIIDIVKWTVIGIGALLVAGAGILFIVRR